MNSYEHKFKSTPLGINKAKRDTMQFHMTKAMLQHKSIKKIKRRHIFRVPILCHFGVLALVSILVLLKKCKDEYDGITCMMLAI